MTLKFDFQQNEVSFFFFLSHLSALSCIGWNYYGERCLEYLSNGSHGAVMAYRFLYILAIFIGPFMTVEAVWTIADIFNALMALPNLIALLALSGVVVAETKDYWTRVLGDKISK